MSYNLDIGSLSPICGEWITQEFASVSFTDKRLDKRFVKTAKMLAKSPLSPINESCKSWAETKGAYRMFDNEKITSQAILKPHIKETIQRISKYPVILVPQDTVFFTYGHHPKTDGIGPIGKGGKNKGTGLIMHHGVAFTCSGLPLGTLYQEITARSGIAEGTKAEKIRRCANATIENKESYKWIDCLSRVSDLSPKSTKLVTLCDRESDIYEFLVEGVENDIPFIIRASGDRYIESEDLRNQDNLIEAINDASIAGIKRVEIKGNGNKKTRIAQVEVKYLTRTLMRPNKKGNSQLSKTIQINVVIANEVNPPKGENQVNWVLFTNEDVKSFDSACEKIDWYAVRWSIEIFHKIMKSGCNVEKCRLETGERLKRFLTLFSIISYRIMHMTLIARTNPSAPCSTILSEDEWNALHFRIHKKKFLNKKLPTVKQVVAWIGELGGHLGRKSDGPPGVTVLWRGLQRLGECTEMWKAFNS